MKSWLAALALPLTLLLAWGCYKPGLKGTGFYCHPMDSPACPDGQACLPAAGGEYRCQDSSGAHLVGDGGTLPRTDGGSGGGRDGGGGSTDMSSGGGMTGCKGYFSCLVACGSSTSCQTGCDSNVTAQGMQLSMDAIGCVQTYCINTTGECMVDSTGTMLVDGLGAPTGSCNNCLNAGLGKLLGVSCSGDPDCNPSSCSTQQNACLADTP